MDIDPISTERPFDTALARLLDREGLVPQDVLQRRLAYVRERRVALPGLTLAGHLLASRDLSGADLDGALARLRAGGEWGSAPGAPRAPTQFGPYAIVAEIAQGGMGAVYEAVHAETRARVAVKTLIGAAESRTVAQLERFRREVEAMGRVNHPALARIHSAEFGSRVSYLVQEFLPGGTIRERLAVSEPSASEIVTWTLALAEGLAHCHAVGVLHRDLKPDNVVFDEAGAPKLVDFGLAYLSGLERLTVTGALTGTPAYMSPEQARGLGTDDVRVDVYGLGTILYYLLCGQAPFQGESLYVILAQILNQPPEPFPRGERARPRWLEAVCSRALAKEPADRYQTMEEFAAALRAGPPRRARLGVVVGATLLGGAAFVTLAASGPGLWGAGQGGSTATSPPPPFNTPATSPRDTARPSASPEASAQVSGSPLASPDLPVPGSLGAALRRWDPPPGALGACGYQVVVCGELAVTLERPWQDTIHARPQEQHLPARSAVRVWRLRDGAEVRRLAQDTAHGLALSPQGDALALADSQGVRVYDTRRWDPGPVLPLSSPLPLRDLEFSPSGRLLAVTHWDMNTKEGSLQVFDRVAGRLVYGASRPIPRFAFRGETQLLAFDPTRKSLALWDLDAQSEVYAREIGPGAVTDLQISPDGALAFATLYEQASVLVWDVEQGRELERIPTSPFPLRVVPDPAWRRALVLAQAEVFRFDIATRKVEVRGRVWDQASYGGALLPDGRALVLGPGQRLRLLGPDLELCSDWGGSLNQRGGLLRTLFYDPQGRPVISDHNAAWRLLAPAEAPVPIVSVDSPGGLDALVPLPGAGRAWIAAARNLLEYDFHLDRTQHIDRAPLRAWSLAPSSDGQSALVVSRPTEDSPAQLVHVRRTPDRPVWTVLRVPGVSSLPSALVVASARGGARGFSGDAAGVLRLWDLESLSHLRADADPEGEPVLALEVDAQERVWAGDRAGRIRRWDPNDPERTRVLRGHAGPILSLCLLPRDRLASASADGTLRVWDLSQGREVRRQVFSDAAGAPRLLAYANQRLLVGTLRGNVFEYGDE